MNVKNTQNAGGYTIGQHNGAWVIKKNGAVMTVNTRTHCHGKYFATESIARQMLRCLDFTAEYSAEHVEHNRYI